MNEERLELIIPTNEYKEQVMEYKRIFLENEESFDGCAGLEECNTYEEWLENTLKNNEFNFAIVDLENDELIGNCGIMNINQINRSAEVGIFIGDENKRSNGYGTESLRLLLDYGFNYLNLNNIHLGVKAFNERAIACYKKVGFKEYGRRREAYFLNGKYYDHVFMDILAREFEGNYIKNKNI